MSPELVGAALGSTVVAAAVAGVVNSLFQRRKLGAEATEIITKAATGVVERLEAEVGRLIGRVEALEGEKEHSRDVLQLHASWDHMAVEIIQDAGLGGRLPQPPPLFPPPASRAAPRP